MKFIVVTEDFRGLPIAKHLKDEGNEVTLCVIDNKQDICMPGEKADEKPADKERRIRIGDGLVNKIPLDKLMKVLPSLDRKQYFIFFDDNALYQVATKIAPLGFPGNYPTLWDRTMEVDRKKAKEFVQKNYPGVQVAEYHEFKKVPEVEQFLEETEKEWVLKGFSPDATTVCPNIDDVELAREQILNVLHDNPKDYESEGFILEEYLPNPIEITPEAMFYDGELLFTDIDLEYKKLGSGDVGKSTGCAGDLVFMTPSGCSLNEIAFPEAVRKLAKQHAGLFVWDISLLIDRKTNAIYFGEFCPNRVGINAFYTELSHLDTVSEFFESVVTHKNPFVNSVEEFASSVTLFNLDTEKDTDTPKADINIKFPEYINSKVWILDSYLNGKELCTSGSGTMAMAVTGRGNSIQESSHDCFNNLNQVSFEEVYYRYQGDYLDTSFPTSIVNRYTYLKNRKLI